MNTNSCDLPSLVRSSLLNLREIIFEDESALLVRNVEHQAKYMPLESKAIVDAQGIEIEREMVLAENTALRNRLDQILRISTNDSSVDQPKHFHESGRIHNIFEDLKGLVSNIVQQCNNRCEILDNRFNDISDVQQRTWMTTKQIGPLTEKIILLKAIIVSHEERLTKLHQHVAEVSSEQNSVELVYNKNSAKALSDQNSLLTSKVNSLNILCERHKKRISLLEDTLGILEDNGKIADKLLRSLEMR